MGDQSRRAPIKPHYYRYDPEDSVLVCGSCGALIWEATQEEHETFHRTISTEQPVESQP